MTADEVIVVGAGVSGCACAATLAAAGIPVLLVSSALDVVGLPGYGPVVEGTWERLSIGSGPSTAGAATETLSWAETIEPALLDVWQRWAWAPAHAGLTPGPPDAQASAGARVNEAHEASDPATGAGDVRLMPRPEGVADHRSPFLTVDRRALSVDVKQLLESYPRLRMRQGSVVSVRPCASDVPAPLSGSQQEGQGAGPSVSGGVQIETAFGEVFEGVACVLAVGLGLGGRVTLGEQVLQGARYGEVAADPLLHELESIGLPTWKVSVDVGAWLSLPPEETGSRAVVTGGALAIDLTDTDTDTDTDNRTASESASWAAVPDAQEAHGPTPHGPTPDELIPRMLGRHVTGAPEPGHARSGVGQPGCRRAPLYPLRGERAPFDGFPLGPQHCITEDREAILWPGDAEDGRPRFADEDVVDAAGGQESDDPAGGRRAMAEMRGAPSGQRISSKLHSFTELHSSAELRAVPWGPRHPAGLGGVTVCQAASEGGLGLVPDGLATTEWYAPSGVDALQLDPGSVVVRPPHSVCGRVLAPPPGRSSDTRVAGGPLERLDGVWIAGQVAGARSYAESLASGSLVARSIIALLDGLSVERCPDD